MTPITTLKKRRYFLAANTSGLKAATSSCIVQAAKLDDALQTAQAELHLGYTVTKKVGNAVVRNRIKRRLREAARQSFKPSPTHYFVLIGRPSALTCDFSILLRDLKYAQRKLGGAKMEAADK